MDNVVLSSISRATVLSLQRTSRLIDVTSLRLATGLKVNTALENPQAYFAAESLKSTASDYNRLIDKIGQSSRTVDEALTGLNAINRLVDQAEAILTETKQKLITEQADDSVYEVEVDLTPPSLSTQIFQANPDVYYRLDDGGPTADDSGFGGGVTATYNSGVTTGAPALYANGGTGSAQFDGVNDHIRVTNSNLINLATYQEKTVELVFNADNVTARQVLYEEGAQVNSFAIYVFNGRVYVTGTDQGAWGPNSAAGPTGISAPINAGETYHVAFVFNSVENRFEGYLNGQSIGSVTVANSAFPSHSGAIGIGSARSGLWFDDITSNSNAFFFDGRISDVAIYTSALTDDQIGSHANSLNSQTTIEYHHRDFEKVMDQIEALTEDSGYRGINLLTGDTLTTTFNPDGNSRLITQGIDVIGLSKGVPRNDFNNLNDVEIILEKVRSVRDVLRRYGRTLVSDLSVIQTREDYTRQKVNTLESGADDLTLADQNEEGANILALQVRQNLGVTALNMATLSSQQTLRLF